MATVKDGWRPPEGTCPSCFTKVLGVVEQHGGKLEVWCECYCMHIHELYLWPFEEEHVSLQDLKDVGLVVRPRHETVGAVEDEQASYLEDVDYGWERSHF